MELIVTRAGIEAIAREEAAQRAALNRAKQTVAAMLPADWIVKAEFFDHNDKAGFAIQLPNKRRHGVSAGKFPVSDAVIIEVADRLRAWGEAHITDPPAT